MTRGPPAPPSGFSSIAGGGGMSSILGLIGSADVASGGAGGAGAAALLLAKLRQANRAPMPSTSTAAIVAYFAFPPDAGTPAGGRLEGELIRKWSLRAQEPGGASIAGL